MSVVRFYRALCRLFPSRYREMAGSGPADTFASMWSARRGVRRLRLLLVAFPHLCAALLAEWWDVLKPTRKRGGMGVGDWVRSVGRSARTLGRAPTFTLSVILLMGVGIGGVVTVFALADHLLLRPLPYPDAERIAMLDHGSYSYPVVRDLEGLQSASAWAAASAGPATLTGAGEPQLVRQVRVNPSFFDVFGARAARGRLFADGDFGPAGPVVISGGAWQRIWGGERAVLGSVIHLDGEPRTVVGILDPEYDPPARLTGDVVDFWLPVDPTSEPSKSRNYYDFEVAARLAPGATLGALTEEVDALARRLAETYPDRYRNRDGSYTEMPVMTLLEGTVGAARRPVLLLLAGAVLLLVIACANVAHLALTRGLSRVREFALRRAIGAGTGDVAGQVLGESLILGLAGGILGALLAAAAVSALRIAAPLTIPRLAEVTVDARVIAFAIAVATLTSVLFGLLPALGSLRVPMAGTLRGGGRSQTMSRRQGRLRGLLVVAEIALSLVLVIQAGLLARTLAALGSVDPGFEVSGLWAVTLPIASIPGAEDRPELVESIRTAVAAQPGVRAVSYGLTMPLQWTGGARCCRLRDIIADGSDQKPTLTWWHPVRHDYFEVVGIELLEGRLWTNDLAPGTPLPIVINESLAQQLFGRTRGVLGRTVDGDVGPAIIIGVAADVKQFGLEVEHGPAGYGPPERLNRATLALRAEPGANVADLVREAVWSVAPTLPVPTVERMEDVAHQSIRGPRFNSVMLASFGGVALLLAAAGLSGTLFYLVGERRREIGIRMAVGAGAGRVERDVVLQGIVWGTLGILLGLAGGLGGARLLQSQLFGVERTDTVTLLGAAGLLLAVAIFASWLPARRAARVDPLEALRAD